MQRSRVEHWFRKRYAFPLVLAGAVMLLVVSEWTHRHTAHIVRSASRLTDARIAISRILQLVTDAESAERSFLLTGSPDDLTAYNAAKTELSSLTGTVFQYTQDTATDARDAARQLAQAVAQRLGEFDAAIAAPRAQATEAHPTTVAGRENMAALRRNLESQLTHAAVSQQQVRTSIYDALLLNRISVATLTLLSVLALYLFLRQLRRQDHERSAQQAALHSEHGRLEQEVLSRTAELRELASHLQTAREDERAHLARELHDELGALLTASKLDVARLRSKMVNQPELLERTELLNQRLNEGIALKRRIIEDLRPSSLSNLGLISALETLCREASERMSVPVRIHLAEVRLSSDAELAVFRFVQEALTNIAKYARARGVDVSLASEGGQAVAQVRDDGVGFDDKARRAGHHGLAGMRFRVESLGGSMSVISRPGHGTQLRAELPQRSESAPVAAGIA